MSKNEEGMPDKMPVSDDLAKSIENSAKEQLDTAQLDAARQLDAIVEKANLHESHGAGLVRASDEVETLPRTSDGVDSAPPLQVPSVISSLLRDVARLNDWRTESEGRKAPPFPRQPPATAASLADRFIYHPPSSAGKDRHAALSEKIFSAAMSLDATCPDCREKSLAMTKLEEAKFWASAAVARNPETR
jgi:hypothetical protein